MLQASSFIRSAQPERDRVALLEEAAGSLAQVADDLQRSRLCARVASAFAHEKLLRTARLTADGCSSNDDRLAGYAAVLEAWSDAPSPGDEDAPPVKIEDEEAASSTP